MLYTGLTGSSSPFLLLSPLSNSLVDCGVGPSMLKSSFVSERMGQCRYIHVCMYVRTLDVRPSMLEFSIDSENLESAGYQHV